jgi:hypothetical protein
VSKLLFVSNPLGHAFEGDCDARTCTREGCGETRAFKHSWNDGEVTKEPQIGVAGEMMYACIRDGCNATKTEEIPALKDPNASSSEDFVDSSSSEEIVDSSSDSATEESSSSASGGLGCGGSVTGMVGLIGIVATSAFVLWKKKED